MQLYEGIIKSWIGDKGFGFIQPNGEGKDIFIHIRDLKHSNYQPRQGDNVFFKLVVDKNGKLRAYDAFIKGQEISQPYRKKSFKTNQPNEQNEGGEYRLGTLPIWVIAMIPFVSSVFLIQQPNLANGWSLETICSTAIGFLTHKTQACNIYKNLHIPTSTRKFIPFIVYFFLSLFTFIAYALDKIKAHRNEWRISEKTLHWLEFLGGWPGALIAQRVIRHKNKKASFQVIFWVIVIIHITIWTDIVLFKSAGFTAVLCQFQRMC
jgi:uncharacterized membrane protein YsdA (DUF1294 family)/cold shock CspA family protein